MGIMGAFKNMIINWLGFTPQENTQSMMIRESLTFDMNVLQNRVWYRGEPAELDQFYSQIDDMAGNTNFWRAKSSHGVNFRKIHSGLPALIVDVLTGIVVADFLGVDTGSKADVATWEAIANDNKFDKLLSDAVKTTLICGDGAFKISVDKDLTPYPIIEFYGADRVDIVYDRGRLSEVIFKTQYSSNSKSYTLKEFYGKGYIKYRLYDRQDKEVALSIIDELGDLADVIYQGNFIMAVPLMFTINTKYERRGRSIFEGKCGVFDGLDECISQWIDALRAGRATVYIPESMIPRDPNTGALWRSNMFDRKFATVDSNTIEGAPNKIEVIQPDINTQALLETYISFLDICLQGIIAPSTLGIDVKKLDNAEAQREKEKATLYTRNKIVDALDEVIPALVKVALMALDISEGRSAGEYELSVSFGEYANPSFEAVVETVGKAYSLGIMSVERVVDEMYGDTWTDAEKAEEVRRLKEAASFTANEPSVGENIAEDDFIDEG